MASRKHFTCLLAWETDKTILQRVRASVNKARLRALTADGLGAQKGLPTCAVTPTGCPVGEPQNPHLLATRKYPSSGGELVATAGARTPGRAFPSTRVTPLRAPLQLFNTVTFKALKIKLRHPCAYKRLHHTPRWGSLRGSPRLSSSRNSPARQPRCRRPWRTRWDALATFPVLTPICYERG